MMKIYMIITVFEVVVFSAGPVPYTLGECIDSLHVLTLPARLEAKAHCVERNEKPALGNITIEQQRMVDEWVKLEESSSDE